MTLWHQTYPIETANGADRTCEGSNLAQDSGRPNTGWPSLRADLVVCFGGLILGAAVATAFWLVL